MKLDYSRHGLQAFDDYDPWPVAERCYRYPRDAREKG